MSKEPLPACLPACENVEFYFILVRFIYFFFFFFWCVTAAAAIIIVVVTVIPCLLLLLFVWDDLGILPEALRTKCARCSPQQLEGGLRVITKLYYDYPTQYARLRSKWDPNNEYHRRFEEYLRGLQFNTINSDPVSRKCDFWLKPGTTAAPIVAFIQISTVFFFIYCDF